MAAIAVIEIRRPNPTILEKDSNRREQRREAAILFPPDASRHTSPLRVEMRPNVLDWSERAPNFFEATG
jgi:hypothetical protein